MITDKLFYIGMILAKRNLAHESHQKNQFYFLDFHMDKFVSTTWISSCYLLGKFIMQV